MGTNLSIDKHASNIDDILDIPTTYFDNIKVESTTPESITQHIKIWRYYEDERKVKTIKSDPISIKDLLNGRFNFTPNECYLVLYIYKKQLQDISTPTILSQTMWGMVESSSNLTPRGLQAPVSTSRSGLASNRHVLGSILLPNRSESITDGKLEYMIFVWNGKNAQPFMKSMALSVALNLDTMINKAKENFLQVLFAGGYIKDKKLWAGKVLQLDSNLNEEETIELVRKIAPLRGKIHLFKFLFPEIEHRQLKTNGFRDKFIKIKPIIKEEDDFILIDEELRDHPEISISHSPIGSPASFVNTVSECYDASPLESGREYEDYQRGMPNLIFSMTKNQNQDTISQRILGNDLKTKKQSIPIPNLNLKLNKLGGSDTVPKEAKPEPLISSEGKTISDDKHDDDSQILSLMGTSDSRDSRLQIEEIKKVTKAPNTKLALGNIPTSTPNIENYADFKKSPFNINAKESDIKRSKMEYYSEQCNIVIEDFLFLAGEVVAYNEKKLSQYGITHIVNAAGDACESKFADKIKYLTFYLKDARVENIECVFYDVIQFIDKAREEKGRVLVHCVQGISRSVTLCMSYLIYRLKKTFNEAYNHIRAVREIASPNPAFWAQLYNFQLRLNGPFSSIPSPRVFALGSFQKETPQTIVARLLFETSNLFNNKTPKTFDPRGVFILQSENSLYLWIGSKVLPANKEKYINKAEEHIKLLQANEHAPESFVEVNQEEEPEGFWKLWEQDLANKYGENEDWNHWYVDLTTHKNVEGTTMFEEQEDQDDNIISNIKTGLYCYPELEPLPSIDLEELIEDNLLILCTQIEDQKIAFLWKGEKVPPKVEVETYLANVLRQKWPEIDNNDILISQEEPNQESEAFMEYFE